MRVYLLTAVGEKSLADMRKDVYSKLLTMPMSFFTEKRVGELSNRILVGQFGSGQIASFDPVSGQLKNVNGTEFPDPLPACH